MFSCLQTGQVYTQNQVSLQTTIDWFSSKWASVVYLFVFEMISTHWTNWMLSNMKSNSLSLVYKRRDLFPCNNECFSTNLWMKRTQTLAIKVMFAGWIFSCSSFGQQLKSKEPFAESFEKKERKHTDKNERTIPDDQPKIRMRLHFRCMSRLW